MSTDPTQHEDAQDDTSASGETETAPEPATTDHPVGADQAAENAENESAS